MVIRSTFLFSHWIRKGKTDDPVIVSSFAFNSGTKILCDSLCPTILIFPHPTLVYDCGTVQSHKNSSP